MPLLWLLFPLAAAVAYFSLARSRAGLGASSADGGGDVFYPETVFYPEPAPAVPYVAAIPAAGLGDYALTLPEKLFRLPAAARPYESAIAATEQRYGIPDSILARLLYQESRFRPDIITGQVKSSAGALGIAQIMPGTARDLGVNPLDPQAAIEAAGRYLKQQFDRFGDWAAALAAYNWGPGNVARKGIAAAPRETQDYVRNILSLGVL